MDSVDEPLRDSQPTQIDEWYTSNIYNNPDYETHTPTAGICTERIRLHSIQL